MATREPTTEQRLALGKRDHGRLTSDEEFAYAEFEEPWTYEKINGRLFVMSPEGTGHVSQSEPWRDRLGAYRLSRPANPLAIVSQAWIRINKQNTRIADIGVYLDHNLEDLDLPDQTPDLVFEFVSQTKRDRTRDYVDKRADYQKKGVREYMIVDRYDQKVTVLSLTENGYQERVLTAADTYRSPLLPGFEVVLAEVLPR